MNFALNNSSMIAAVIFFFVGLLLLPVIMGGDAPLPIDFVFLPAIVLGGIGYAIGSLISKKGK